ncbi:unnamed protein product [Anisakis simplex]|uniref:Uncharacterized protein n=1 Tax=Anisakis simplex TaxID=6269 RepID=A0A0M3J611_ANISI|nr:unnamed protein product [Anisakis simplex]
MNDDRKEESAKSNSDLLKRWWAMTMADKRPTPDPTKLVTVNELPMYAEDVPVQYSLVPAEPLPLQGQVSKVRKAIVHQYDQFAHRYQTADKAAKNSMRAVCGWSSSDNDNNYNNNSSDSLRIRAVCYGCLIEDIL